VNVKGPGRSLIQPTRSTSSMSSTSSGSIRTAKAEKRLKEKLSKEGVRFAEETKDMSPSEQRALQAEKRAAWRQARLKSLEQDALQAQMVLNRMNEAINSPSVAIPVKSPSTFLPSPQSLDNSKTPEPDAENNTEVETTEQKIISIELQGPRKGSSLSQSMEESSEPDLPNPPATPTSSTTPVNPRNSSKVRRKKNSKKK